MIKPMRCLPRNGIVKLALIAIFLMTPPTISTAIDLLGSKYGSLKRSREVTKVFETPKILPNHRYYYYGWGEVPNAIIGINESYKFRKGLWREINLTVPLLRSWVHQMDMIYGYRPYGSQILDHIGNQVGIWYSSKQWTPVIIDADNQISVFTPEPPGFRGDR